MRDNKGITIVALVITIIVLLILAGVSISAVMSDNGIVGRASEVDVKYSKVEVKEGLFMKINEKVIEAYKQIDGTSNDISTTYNEDIMIPYLENTEDDATAPGIDWVDADLNSEKVTNVTGDGEVYKIYYIKALKVSDDVKNYGKGTDVTTGDVFTLEPQLKTDENGVVSTTGKYEIKYYDYDKNPEVIDVVDLYLTNKS